MTLTVLDLFSGGGGASYGFKAHPGFMVVGAADMQVGKPSTGTGSLECNATYEANIGLVPVEADLGTIDPGELRDKLGIAEDPAVLISCPPCTGFSRTVSQNHIRDDSRNSLVGKTVDFVKEFNPQMLIMENARELVMGRFNSHLFSLVAQLHQMGYSVSYKIHLLSDFGLPQKRERAIVVAVKEELPCRTITDLWGGFSIDPKATHVRRAIWSLPTLQHGEKSQADPMHAAPRIRDRSVFERLRATPHDGGSWFDLADQTNAEHLLTPTMKDRLARGDLGSHPDVYGRMWWDRSAPTIKRECSHVGNGRYAHPEQDRLCSVREMAILNGFPSDYIFHGALNNRYRHIGDAVPPLVSFQLANLASWILEGGRPEPENLVLPGTHLDPSDIISHSKL